MKSAVLHSSRAEAKANGQSRFFTGKPCSRGHLSIRRVSNHSCCECLKEDRKPRDAKRQNTPGPARDNYLKRMKRAMDRLKLDVLTHYSKANVPKCACCGEKELIFLTLDHINEDGASHRKSISKSGSGTSVYRWLRKNNYPKGFQVLCFNCNFAKHVLGSCPHKKRKT